MSDPKPQGEIDELLDRAYQALIAGDRSTADVLAGQVLAIDRDNAEAEDLLAAPPEQGQIRRLTILFADLVESTELSNRVELETYRIVVGRYREEVRRIVDHYEGHIASIKGDGLLAVFGHPNPHEDDARRAVQAGLDLTGEVARLNEQTQRRFGVGIQVRIGVHRGLVYLDTAQDDVYGFAANLASRLCGLAEPGTVVVSDGIARLIRGTFELQIRPAKPVKGVQGVIEHYRAVGERATRRTSLGPLVDRQREIAYLEAAWAQAQAGTLATPGLGFFGGPGIGKSRLASEAIAIAGRSNAAVAELIGSPFHTDVGLHPVRRLLEGRCQISRISEPAEILRRLEAEATERSLDPATMVPLLAPVLGIAPQSDYESVHAEGRKLREQIIAAVRDYLLASVGDGPELIVVEDMQWFDEDTVEVVQSLLAQDLGRVLVVMVSRQAAALPKGPLAQVFELKPFTDEEADELILALHPQITPGAREAVNERCEGVPLYIEEVVAKLKEERPSDASETTRVPDTLYEALLSRLSSSRAAVQVVEAAATIGSQVDRHLLLSVVDLTESDVDRVMRELIDGRVLEAVDDGGWRFRHELYREVAAELSPPSLRRRLHSRVADALVAAADGGNPDWPLVARHYEGAEQFDEAAAAYQQATAAARRRGALGEARAYLTCALAQIERLPSGEPRDQREIALRLRRGFLAYAAEGTSSPQAAADFERCLQVTSQSRQLYMTLSALYGYYATRADLRRAQQVLESTHTALSAGWGRLIPENMAGFGMVAWYRGEFDSARGKLEAAGAARNNVSAEEFDAIWFMPNEAIASIFTHLALARFVQGDLAGAEAELAKTKHRCEQLGFPQGPCSLAYAQWMEAWISREAGQLDRAAKVAADLALNAERHGFDFWALAGATERAVVCAASSLAAHVVDPAVLQSHVATVTEFVNTFRALEVKALTTRYDGVIARLLVSAGWLAEACDRVNTGLRLAEETGMRFYDAELLRIRAHTHENHSERRADLNAAVELARQQSATIFELRAAADDFELNGETARLALNDAVNRFPSDSTWPELIRAQALLRGPVP